MNTAAASSPSVPAAGWLREMPWLFVLIWSTGFIVARYGMPYAPPLKFLSVRYALTIVCFGAWVVAARIAGPKDRAQWGHLMVTGLLMQAGYLGGVWSAVHAGMGAALVSLLVGIQPVLTAVWLAARGRAVSRRQWSGLAIGFLGLLMVLWHKLELGSEVSPTTMTLAVVALLSITAGTLYQKRFVAPCDVRMANLLQQLAALALTLPFALLLEHGHIDWNWTSGAAMAWAVLALSLGGSSLLYLLIQSGSATSVSSLLYLVPPCTAVLAWLLFREPIGALTTAGIALAALGVALVVHEPAPRVQRS